MRTGLVALALVLVVAAPAHAGWSPPRDFANGAFTSATAAVASDGTTVATWRDAAGIIARVGHGRPIVVSTAYEAQTVATAHGAFIGWTVGPHRAVVARALPRGLLGPPHRVGGGRLAGLAADARGDVAAVTMTTPPGGSFNQTALRPVGGVFGAPVTLPATQVSAFTLSPRGETLVAMTDPGAIQGVAQGFDVSTRSGEGTVTTTPFDVHNGGTMDGAALAADAHGRVLAVWAEGFRIGFFATVRSPDGVWSPPVFEDVKGTLGPFAAAVTRSGRAVIAWRDGEGRARYTPEPPARPRSRRPALSETRPEGRACAPCVTARSHSPTPTATRCALAACAPEAGSPRRRRRRA